MIYICKQSHLIYICIIRGGTEEAQIRMPSLATPFEVVLHWKFVGDMTHMGHDSYWI